MSRLAVALILPLLLLAAPGTATADVIFDPADADDLAASLAEAYTDQGVCYGWQVTVDDVATTSESVGSNFGAGKPVSSGTCDKTVEFHATITYTSESSESEDSASYDVTSTPSGVTRDDLNALGIDFDDLTGDNPDVPIGKAVIALPLLAADKGLAAPLSATPDNATAPADAQLTDDPGSDWWRDRGGMLLWGLALIAAGGVFVWWVLRTSRRAQRRTAYLSPAPVEVPDSVPAEWAEPPTEPMPAQKPEATEPDSAPEPAPKPAATEPESAPAADSEATATEPGVAGEPSSPEQVPAPTPEPAAEPEAAEPAADSEQKPADRPAPAAETTEAESSSAGPAGASTEDPAGPALEAGDSEVESSSVEPPATSTEDPTGPTPEAEGSETEPASAEPPDTSTEDPARPASSAEVAEAESSSVEPPATSTEDQARPAPSDRQDKE